jgi:hypothetical protein
MMKQQAFVYRTKMLAGRVLGRGKKKEPLGYRDWEAALVQFQCTKLIADCRTARVSAKGRKMM